MFTKEDNLPGGFYKFQTGLSYSELMSRSDIFISGNEYMNEIFTADELKHGTRYIVCVHADLKVIDRGTWMEELPAVSTCSDGVVVDLTPPMAGKVWISHSPDIRYQVI